MARERKKVHKVQMTDGKRAIIHQLLDEYDIQTAEDIQDALKDLLGGTIKEMTIWVIQNHNVQNPMIIEMVTSRSVSTAVMVPWKSMFHRTVVLLLNHRL